MADGKSRKRKAPVAADSELQRAEGGKKRNTPDAEATTGAAPQRRHGVIHFADRPDFQPNLTPKEVGSPPALGLFMLCGPCKSKLRRSVRPEQGAENSAGLPRCNWAGLADGQFWRDVLQTHQKQCDWDVLQGCLEGASSGLV